MKKNKITRNILLAISLIAVMSCEKKIDSDGLSKITYYPNFTMNGDAEMLLSVGADFTDPGVVATENGNEIPNTVTVTGDFFSGAVSSVNTDVADKYIINYSATNSDGFAGTISRSVYVYNTGDLVNSIEGLYTSTIYRSGALKFVDLPYVMIVKTGTDEYTITDAIGGYYDIGRAYGATYRASGLTIIANDISANDFSFSPASIGVGAFGGVLDGFVMTVDPITKTITLDSSWDAGYTFNVILTQV
jgi:hypothetical protein